MFDLAEIKRVDDRIRLIKQRIREDSIGSLESAFSWLPEYWWSEDRYANLFIKEDTVSYRIKRDSPESPQFKKNWIPSIIKKFYPADFQYNKETVTLSASITVESHCITVEGKYRISFDPREIAKYPSPGLIVAIRFVNYIRKANGDNDRLVFGFNDDESRCFVISTPVTLIKRHNIEVLDTEVKPYFGFSTR